MLANFLQLVYAFVIMITVSFGYRLSLTILDLPSTDDK